MVTAVKVEISKEKQEKINDLVSDIVTAKKNEKGHKIDNKKESKRFFTGLMGEAAVEQLLNMDIIEWEADDSRKFNHPDIPGYKVGVKTVEYGKYPIIFKKNSYPQIFCVLDTKQDGVVYVCGLATPEVLNKYQDDNLILDPNLRKKGSKTGFYGFKDLQAVNSVLDIEKYRKN